MTKSTRKNSKGGHKRRSDPFPGLNKKHHPRSRWEYLDSTEYAHKLSDTDKAYLSKFLDEYYGATLANKDDWPGRKKDLHRLKKDRKACQQRNNERLRDITSLAKSLNNIDSISDKHIQITEVLPSNVGSVEDAVIAVLDLKLGLKSDD